ncbi:hypothetical protein G6F60_015106 [Rhizopus arrhizus]|nr:hypothetical protein G6F60_015106 [Rhizopus arrhizus]
MMHAQFHGGGDFLGRAGPDHRQRRAAIASAPVLHIRVSVRAGAAQERPGIAQAQVKGCADIVGADSPRPKPA